MPFIAHRRDERRGRDRQSDTQQEEKPVLAGRVANVAGEVRTVGVHLLRDGERLGDADARGLGAGEVAAMGPPTAILKAKRSHTAKVLRAFLNGGAR